MRECIIAGKTFQFVQHVFENEEYRENYFLLAQKCFKLNLKPWYESGFCNGNFIPYTLYDGKHAVASVGVASGEFIWQNIIIKYAQLSTVMTLPEYRRMNLSKWLMQLVLKEWKEKSDIIYLYANDSVLDFYPKFGFEKAVEYMFTMQITKQKGNYRKLDMTLNKDVALLLDKYKTKNNPFATLQAKNNISQMMFHCITVLNDNIYYIEEMDAIIIAECNGKTIFCYDIYAEQKYCMTDIIGVLVDENIECVKFGFTPDARYNCKCEISNEKDTTLFVLETKHNFVFKNKITLPFMTRA